MNSCRVTDVHEKTNALFNKEIEMTINFLGLPPPHLLLLSEGETLIIPACDGSKSIANAGLNEKIFLVERQLKSPTFEHKSKSTVETNILVYGIKGNGFSIKNILESLSKDLDKLLLTQHQIVHLLTTQSNWLCPHTDRGTYFLIKIGGTHLIVCASVLKDHAYFLLRIYPLNESALDTSSIVVANPNSNFINSLPI